MKRGCKGGISVPRLDMAILNLVRHCHSLPSPPTCRAHVPGPSNIRSHKCEGFEKWGRVCACLLELTGLPVRAGLHGY